MARRAKGPPPPEAPIPTAVGEHIETIAQLEHQWLRERKVGEHVGDALAGALGTLEALVFHAVWFVAWIVVNLGWLPGVAPFDPFPFGLLTLLVSLEAIFLSLFLLISQKRLTHQTEKRAHFDMQINMLAETEVTAILVLVRKLCDKLGIEDLNESELRELARPTDLKKLFQAVERKIPDATNDPL